MNGAARGKVEIVVSKSTRQISFTMMVSLNFIQDDFKFYIIYDVVKIEYHLQ